MYFILLLLYPVTSLVKGLPECPFPDFPICGSDGITFGNLCELKLRTLLKTDLRLTGVGPCNVDNFNYPYESLLRTTDTGNEQILRSKNKKGKAQKLREELLYDILERLGYAILILTLQRGGVWACALGDGPVCGNNNKTYDDICALLMAKYFHVRLTLAHRGACATQTRRDGAHRELSSGSDSKILLKKILKKREIKKKAVCGVQKIEGADFRRK